uniref:Uncharacterized protein n=1 Tax=Eutreptiella gymnastica TaxID=73025 RepID=A0A7S4LHM7_9EUGL
MALYPLGCLYMSVFRKTPAALVESGMGLGGGLCPGVSNDGFEQIAGRSCSGGGHSRRGRDGKNTCPSYCTTDPARRGLMVSRWMGGCLLGSFGSAGGSGVAPSAASGQKAFGCFSGFAHPRTFVADRRPEGMRRPESGVYQVCAHKHGDAVVQEIPSEVLRL